MHQPRVNDLQMSLKCIFTLTTLLFAFNQQSSNESGCYSSYRMCRQTSLTAISCVPSKGESRTVGARGQKLFHTVSILHVSLRRISLSRINTEHSNATLCAFIMFSFSTVPKDAYSQRFAAGHLSLWIYGLAL